jgi:hypothetical protein
MSKPSTPSVGKSNEELLAEVARLEAQLQGEIQLRTEAQEMAALMAEASQFTGANVEEQPTGDTVEVEVCLNPYERDIKKQKFKTVNMPTYFYHIQLPAGAGLCLSTNGAEFYHGETYTFDIVTLAEIKSRVAKCWDHEKSIHGDNENAYRRPTNKHFMSPAAAKRLQSVR